MPTLLQRERLILPPAWRLALDLDGNDLSTLFQDSAFTTAVTTTADPVGGWKDKSGRGNHATQATSARRPTWNSSSVNSLGGVAFLGSSTQFLNLPALNSPGVLILVTRVTSGSGSRTLANQGAYSLTLDNIQRWSIDLGALNSLPTPANPSNHVAVVVNRGDITTFVAVDGTQQARNILAPARGTGTLGATAAAGNAYTGEHARVLYVEGVLRTAEINAWLSTLYGTFAISGSYLK